jgi:hypothetical protein
MARIVFVRDDIAINVVEAGPTSHILNWAVIGIDENVGFYR